MHCNGDSTRESETNNMITSYLKDTLWVLRGDEPSVHVSIDISLITKHILDHDILLKS